MTDLVGGIDLSRHQEGPNDFHAVRQSGRAFAVTRWSVGPYRDDKRVYNLPAIYAAGLIPGAYHVLSDRHDPTLQAREFVDSVTTIAAITRGKAAQGAPFLWVLDAEHSGTVGDPTVAQCVEFLDELHRLTGRPPLAYIPRWWMVTRDWDASDVAAVAATGALWWASRYPLSVNFDRPPEQFHGWRAALWQYTSSAFVPGIPGLCDDNVFYGTPGQLAAVAGAQPTDQPTTEEDRMLWLIKGADRDEWWLTDWMTKRHIVDEDDAAVVIWCQASAGQPVRTRPGNQPHVLSADQQDTIDRIPVLEARTLLGSVEATDAGT